MTQALLLPLILGGMFVLGIVAVPLAKSLGRSAGFALAAGYLTGAGAIASLIPGVLAGRTFTYRAEWIPSLGIEFSLRLDGLSSLFSLLILVIGALVMAYCSRYLDPGKSHASFYSTLTFFAASMLGLVQAGDGILLFVFWEATSISSFFLIGGRGTDGRLPAMRALLVTALGGLALFAAVVLLSTVTGTFDLSKTVTDAELVRSSNLMTPIMILLLIGAFTKSAQFPLHFWLPGAMVAPTPVSTYLHAATMVKAGIYLLARLSPLFAGLFPWSQIILFTGLVTALIGAGLALKQHDLKALLAYSTVSQLGFITALVGLGTPAAIAAAVAHIVAHAMYKATLFMIVGVIDSEAGSRDIRRLSGLRKAMPVTASFTALAALSMAGFPPFLGFVSKEEAFGAFLSGGGASASLAAALALGAAVMTFGYGARIFHGTFEGPLEQELYEPKFSFVAPAGIAAAGGLVMGIGLPFLDPFLSRVGEDVLGFTTPVHLSIWHGFTPALVLSSLTIAGGLMLFFARRSIDRLFGSFTPKLKGNESFDRLYDGVMVLGRAVGAPFLSNVPAIHLSWIFGAGALAVGVAASLSAVETSIPAPPSAPEDWAVVGLVAAACIAIVLARSRLAAAAILGIAGFLVAVMYVLLGAPDLALTQLLVETLTVVLIVLVFRRLPEMFRPVSLPRRIFAVLVSAAVGISAGFGTFVLAGRRDMSRAGRYYLESALDEAGGRNVVNTILVDFRALDTLGEIAVLAMAALGVAALAWTALESDPAKEAKGSVILGTMTRILTPAILAVSIYFLVRGHDSPGGGFIGALIAGSSIVLAYMAGGRGRLDRWMPFPFSPLVGAGVLVAVLVGAIPLLLSRSFLEGGSWNILSGTKLSSSLFFDVGVFVIVFGMVLGLIRHLGEEQ